MDLQAIVELLATGFEVAGAGTMVVGAVLSLVLTLKHDRSDGRALYRGYRNRLGRSIILGLELLVAADILRTVSEIPTLERVLILAAIVLIRTFLSFSLAVELEGRWPWQRARSGAESEA